MKKQSGPFLFWHFWRRIPLFLNTLPLRLLPPENAQLLALSEFIGRRLDFFYCGSGTSSGARKLRLFSRSIGKTKD